MKKIFSKEFAIGLSVIVALLILFFGIDYLKGINLFKPANFYTVQYDNVAGLEIAAPVSIDGFKVGQVREINFNYDKPGSKIEVILALDKNLRLPRGSAAVIESSLLSGAYITLRLGSGPGHIPVGGNVNPAVTPDLMKSIGNEIMPAAGSILPKVDSLMYNLNLLASNPALNVSLQRLDGITFNALAATHSLNKSFSTQIPSILRNANSISYRIDTVSGNLSRFSNSLAELPLSSTMDSINLLTSNLIRLSQQLNSKKSSLGLLMNDPELYNRLTQISADVDSLIVDIKRNPKRYINIKLL